MIGLNVLHIPAALTAHEFQVLNKAKIVCHVIIAWHHGLSILLSAIFETVLVANLVSHYSENPNAELQEALVGLEGCGGQNFEVMTKMVQEIK